MYQCQIAVYKNGFALIFQGLDAQFLFTDLSFSFLSMQTYLKPSLPYNFQLLEMPLLASAQQVMSALHEFLFVKIHRHFVWLHSNNSLSPELTQQQDTQHFSTRVYCRVLSS